MKTSRVSPATVARLPIYVKGLEAFLREGIRLTSSQQLADVTGIEASQIRRDLSCLGAFGTPGVGYDVPGLHHELAHCLGISRIWPVALVGHGNLGSALTAHGGLGEKNFQIVAIFDCDPDKIGTRVGDLQIAPPERIPAVVRESGIEIAVVATPAAAAQQVANLLVSAGVTALLNFAPLTLVVPHGVIVRNIDVVAEMQILSFHELMRRQPPGSSLRRRQATVPQSTRVGGEAL